MNVLEVRDQWALIYVAWSKLVAPSCFLRLRRLRRQGVIAAEVLTAFFRQYAATMAHQRQERASAPM